MEPKVFSTARLFKITLSCFLLAILTALFACYIGAESISLSKAIKFPLSMEHDILFYSRLPRILLGLLVGMALSSAGVSFQCLLRNPLADPFILGVSGGAALGSVMGIALGAPFFLVSILSFVFAILSMFLIYWVASTKKRLPVHTLLLTGVIFNSFTFAIIMLFNSLVSFQDAHRIWYMMVGSLNVESYADLGVVTFFVVVGLLLLFFQTGKMNLLSLGEESAAYLGCDADKLRRNIFFAASLMIGSCVSVSGLIGFLGLFIPHILRMLVGSDHRILLPASAFFGGAFLIAADSLSRSLFAGELYSTQLPVGVLTAFMGGPFFVFLLKRKKGSSLW